MRKFPETQEFSRASTIYSNPSSTIYLQPSCVLLLGRRNSGKGVLQKLANLAHISQQTVWVDTKTRQMKIIQLEWKTKFWQTIHMKREYKGERLEGNYSSEGPAELWDQSNTQTQTPSKLTAHGNKSHLHDQGSLEAGICVTTFGSVLIFNQLCIIKVSVVYAKKQV